MAKKAAKKAKDSKSATSKKAGAPDSKDKALEVMGDAAPRAGMLDPWERFGQLGDLVARWPEWFSQWPEWLASDVNGIKVEEQMDDDKLVIRGELPGVDPDEDIDISIDNGRLSIRAERKERKESKNGEHGYHSEFRYGSFARVLTLPEGAVADDVSATYTDGILEVTVPIDETSRNRKKVAIAKS